MTTTMATTARARDEMGWMVQQIRYRQAKVTMHVMGETNLFSTVILTQQTKQALICRVRVIWRNQAMIESIRLMSAR
jgi:hypothetical protein